MGILPQHVPLMTQMVPGEMIVRKRRSRSFSGRGRGTRRNHGRPRGHPDGYGHCGREHRRSQSRRSASTRRARLREKISAEEVASVNASLARSLAQLHVKRRRQV